MLNKKSVTLARTLVSNESVFISVKPGSMLEEPALRSQPVLQMRQPSLENYAEAITYSANSEVAGVAFHDSAVLTAVDTIGPALVRQMGYVRKTVVPFISQVTDSLIGKLKGSEPNEYVISQYNPSALAFNPAVLDMLKKYQIKSVPFKRIKDAPAKDESEIINSLRTGISELDDALVEVIARDTLAVQTAYDVLFRNASVNAVNPLSIMLSNLICMTEDGKFEITISDTSQVDFAIVIFFILSVYLEDPLPGTGMGLTEYQTTLNNMRAQLGYLINKSLSWLNSNLRVGTLIMKMSNSPDKDPAIVVFGPVYRQGLAQGLTPESVIGGAIDPAGTQRLLSVQIANKDTNLKRWQALEIARANKSRTSFMNRVAINFASATLEALNDLPDDSFPVGYSKTAAVAKITAEVNQTNTFFSNWNYSEDPDLFSLVKQKVCKYIFTFIDAEGIIDTIENEINDGHLPAPEAAYSAAVRYLAKWLVANCDICEYKLADITGLVGSEIIE